MAHGEPLDFLEVERMRHQNLANSVAIAMTEGFGEFVDSREFMYDDPTFGSGRVGTPILYTTINDRDDGRYLPIYQNQMDLMAIRAEARNVTAMSGGVMGALSTISNYTFGGGMKFTAQRAASAPCLCDETLQAWIVEAQAVIDKFLRENDFQSNMDREIDHRTREDGESFVEIYVSPSGQIRASFDEPDMIVEPMSPGPLEDWLQGQDYDKYSPDWIWSWSFGVHSVRRTPDDPVGYHVVYDSVGDDWEYVDANRMLHVKANVTRNAKRGVSDLYWIANDVLREAKIRRNTADGAALQAAIAWFRQHATGTTKGGVQTMIEGATAAQEQTATRGTLPRKGKLKSGSVVDIPETMEVKPGPMGSERNANFILIAQYVSRAIATRWSMPEFMYTSDASNANYASTLASESPFVKARENDQRFYGQAFVKLLWKVLRLAHEIGRAFRNLDRFDLLMECLEITAEGPRVSDRDELQVVQRQALEIGMGTLSEETAAAEMGRDLAKEQEKGAHPRATPVPVAGAGAPPPSDTGAPPQPEQLDAEGNPIPPPAAPAGEHLGLNLQQILRFRKATAQTLCDFKGGKIDETTARNQLDAIGTPAHKIDSYLQGTQAPEAVTEAIEGDVVPRSRPGPDFPDDIPTQDQLVSDAQDKMRHLISQLGDAVMEGNVEEQKSVQRKMTALQDATVAAASVLGMAAVFKGNILHTPATGRKVPPAKSAVIEDPAEAP